MAPTLDAGPCVRQTVPMPYVVATVNGKRFPFPREVFLEKDVARWRHGPDRYEIVNVVTRRRSVVGGGAGSAQRRHAAGRRPHRAAGHSRYPGTIKTPDPHAQRELELFAENDAGLYRQMLQPIRKNLANKMANGTYLHTRGVDAFMHFVDEAARRYTKEFGGRGMGEFHKIDRRVVAEHFADEFEVEYKLGNYNYLLTAAATKRAIAAHRLPKSRPRTPGGSSR